MPEIGYGPFCSLKFRLPHSSGELKSIKDFSLRTSADDQRLFFNQEESSRSLDLFVDYIDIEQSKQQKQIIRKTERVAKIELNEESGAVEVYVLVDDPEQLIYVATLLELLKNKELSEHMYPEPADEVKIQDIKVAAPGQLIDGKLPKMRSYLEPILFTKDGDKFKTAHHRDTLYANANNLNQLKEVPILVENSDNEGYSHIQVATISFKNKQYHISFADNSDLTEHHKEQIRTLTMERISKHRYLEQVLFTKDGAQLKTDHHRNTLYTNANNLNRLEEVPILVENSDNEGYSHIQVATISFKNKQYHISFADNSDLTEQHKEQIRTLTMERISKHLVTPYSDQSSEERSFYINHYFDSSFLPTDYQNNSKRAEPEPEKEEFERFKKTYEEYREKNGNKHFTKVIDAMGMSLQSKMEKGEIKNMTDVRRYSQENYTCKMKKKITSGKNSNRGQHNKKPQSATFLFIMMK